MTAVLSLMGPNARTLLGRAGGPRAAEALAPERLKFAHTTEIDVGHARVRAARMSYVGGPGFELYVPVEMTRHVYLALHAASEGLGCGGAGLRNAGYYALDALRIEAGRRAWGAELGPDETPVDAGTMFAVKLDKPGGFLGQEALREAAAAAPRKRLVTVVLDSDDAWAWGGEPLTIDGEPVGEITSAGFSVPAGRCIGLGYLRDAAASRSHQGSAIGIDLWGDTVAATAWDRWPPAG
jgi:glycine cleavage system aminomethyltransferase T